MTHTPGPWYLHVDSAGKEFCITNENDETIVSSPIFNIDDAYLMAAARDLLGTIKTHVTLFEKLAEIAPNFLKFVEQAKKLIRDAEGKS